MAVPTRRASKTRKRLRRTHFHLAEQNFLTSVESTRGADPMRLDHSSTVAAAGKVLLGKMEM